MMTKPFDFWQDHSRQFLEMAFGQERRERVDKPDGYGQRTGDCGDTVEFFLNTETDRIRSISYLTNGCLNTNACANTVAHLVEGRSIEAAWEITPEAVIAHLQTLPAESSSLRGTGRRCLLQGLGRFDGKNASPVEKTVPLISSEDRCETVDYP